MKTKITNLNFFQKTIIAGVFFLSFFIFSFFVGAEKSEAQNQKNTCVISVLNTSGKVITKTTSDAADDAACQKLCSRGAPGSLSCEFKPGADPGQELAKIVGQQKRDEIAKLEAEKGGCGITSLDICLLTPVLWFVKVLLVLSASLFAWMVDAKNITLILNQNTAIYTAWKLVRDLLNMVFILVLLFSAFCTIFQVSKYNYKKILLTLVIMALLVNFSFPIARVIIDASNVMMYSIIKTQLTDTSGIFVNIASDSGLGELLKSKYTNSGVMLTSIIFIFILAVTFLAIGILLVIRTVALAVIVIFSPLGFVGNIMPGFEKYASQWWDNLFKYSFFGPIMMLGLYIAISVMKALKDSSVMDSLSIEIQKTIGTGGDPNLLGKLSFYAIPIVILWMTMGLAQSMSIAGASTIMGGAQKFLKWSGRNLTGYNLAKTGVKAGIHKFDRDVLAKHGLSPKTIKEAWKQKGAAKDERVYNVATGKWRDRMNNIFSLGKEKTNFEKTALQTNIAKKQKEISETSENAEYLSSELESAIKGKDSQKAAAIFRILYGNNDQNEMIKNLTEDRIKLYGMEGLKDEKGNVIKKWDVTPEHKKLMVESVLKMAGMKDQDTYKQMMDLGEIAFSKGNYADFAMAGFNVKERVYEKNNNEAQMGAAVGKASNVKAQTKTDLWHWNSFLEEETIEGEVGKGKTGNLHAFGRLQLAKMTGSELGQMTRVRRDFAQKLALRTDDMEDYARELETNVELVRTLFKDELPEDATDEQVRKRGKLQANVIRVFIDKINENAFGKEDEIKKALTKSSSKKDNTKEETTSGPKVKDNTKEETTSGPKVIDPRTMKPVEIDPATGQPFK